MNRRKFIGFGAATMMSGLATSKNNAFSSPSVSPKVLVLGGTGYFGPVLVRELIRSGCNVTLFNRGVSNPHLFPKLERLIGDRQTKDGSGLHSLACNKQDWDWVVDTWKGNSFAVQQTATLLKDRTSLYQYVSTVSVYDKWDKAGITESEPLNPLPTVQEQYESDNRYAIRKTYAENVVKRTFSHNHTLFRSHGMRGYETSKPIHEPYWQVKLQRGGDILLPDGVEYYQVTDTISLAKFMVYCGFNNIFGAFNVAYQPIKFKNFINRIVEHTNSTATIHWIPQETLLDQGVQLIRTIPAGRYRFDVSKAIAAGLANRSWEQLFADQLAGYFDRNPSDDFQFGHPETKTISREKEKQVIARWLGEQ